MYKKNKFTKWTSGMTLLASAPTLASWANPQQGGKSSSNIQVKNDNKSTQAQSNGDVISTNILKGIAYTFGVLIVIPVLVYGGVLVYRKIGLNQAKKKLDDKRAERSKEIKRKEMLECIRVFFADNIDKIKDAHDICCLYNVENEITPISLELQEKEKIFEHLKNKEDIISKIKNGDVEKAGEEYLGELSAKADENRPVLEAAKNILTAIDNYVNKFNEYVDAEEKLISETNQKIKEFNAKIEKINKEFSSKIKKFRELNLDDFPDFAEVMVDCKDINTSLAGLYQTTNKLDLVTFNEEIKEFFKDFSSRVNAAKEEEESSLGDLYKKVLDSVSNFNSKSDTQVTVPEDYKDFGDDCNYKVKEVLNPLLKDKEIKLPSLEQLKERFAKLKKSYDESETLKRQKIDLLQTLKERGYREDQLSQVNEMFIKEKLNFIREKASLFKEKFEDYLKETGEKDSSYFVNKQFGKNFKGSFVGCLIEHVDKFEYKQYFYMYKGLDTFLEYYEKYEKQFLEDKLLEVEENLKDLLPLENDYRYKDKNFYNINFFSSEE